MGIAVCVFIIVCATCNHNLYSETPAAIMETFLCSRLSIFSLILKLIVSGVV